MSTVDIPGQKFENPSAISRGRVSPRAGGRVRRRVCAGGRVCECMREYIQHSKTGCKRRSKQGRCNKGMQQNAGTVAITTCPLDIESCGKRKVSESKGFASVRAYAIQQKQAMTSHILNECLSNQTYLIFGIWLFSCLVRTRCYLFSQAVRTTHSASIHTHSPIPD